MCFRTTAASSAKSATRAPPHRWPSPPARVARLSDRATTPSAWRIATATAALRTQHQLQQQHQCLLLFCALMLLLPSTATPSAAATAAASSRVNTFLFHRQQQQQLESQVNLTTSSTATGQQHEVKVLSSSTSPHHNHHARSIEGPYPWAPAPIRHWWAQHHRRSTTSTDNHKQQLQCLNRHRERLKAVMGLEASSSSPGSNFRHLHQAESWAQRVCSQATLEARVRLLLSESPCERHRVCQVLSPADLRGVESDERRVCMRRVEKWWKVFHAVEMAVLDFDKAFITSLDASQYSVMYDVKRCKVSIR